MLANVELPTADGFFLSLFLFFTVIFCPVLLAEIGGKLIARLFFHQNRPVLAGLVLAAVVSLFSWWVLASPAREALARGDAMAPILISHLTCVVAFGHCMRREIRGSRSTPKYESLIHNRSIKQPLY